LFFSHAFTNWLEGLEGTQFVWQKLSLEMSWKIKGNTHAGQFWLPADFSLFHRWIMLILGYVVCLDVACILNSGDRNIILRQGCIMLNSSSSIFKLARFYSDLGRSTRWIIFILRYVMHNSMIYSLTVGFETIIRGWWLIAFWSYCCKI